MVPKSGESSLRSLAEYRIKSYRRGGKDKRGRVKKSSESHENSRISYSEGIGKLQALQETSYISR